MRQKKSRWIGSAFCTCFAILVLLVWANASAGDLTDASGKWRYVVKNGGAEITDCVEPYGDLIIPSELDGYPVTSIGGRAFINSTRLASVIIPNSVINIGMGAFGNCSGLTRVTLSDSVTIIDDGAFEGCKSLKNITIPNSVKSIGARAFYGCTSLSSVTISSNVASIGTKAFEETPLTPMITPTPYKNTVTVAAKGTTETTAERAPINQGTISDTTFNLIGTSLFISVIILIGLLGMKAGKKAPVSLPLHEEELNQSNGDPKIDWPMPYVKRDRRIVSRGEVYWLKDEDEYHGYIERDGKSICVSKRGGGYWDDDSEFYEDLD